MCGPIVTMDQVKLVISLSGFCQRQQPSEEQNSEQPAEVNVYCNKSEEFLTNLDKKEVSSGCYRILYTPMEKVSHVLSIHWKSFVVNKEINVPVSVRNFSDIKEAQKTICKYGNNDNKVLKCPEMMAIGPNNELVVRDHSSHQLVIFDEHFSYKCMFGEESDRFRSISGIAYGQHKNEKNGQLYVADATLNCIYTFKWDGKKSEFVGQIGGSGTANGQFKSPHGMLLSQSGMLYICDMDNHRVQIFKNETFFNSFGQLGSEIGELNKPVDITMNGNGDHLFVTDSLNQRIQVFNAKGSFLKVFGNQTDVSLQL